MNLRVLAGFAAISLAACGGGGVGSSPSAAGGGIPNAPAGPAKTATETVTFRVPVNPDPSSPASAARNPKSISPGTNNLTLIVDGVRAFDAVAIYNTGPTQNFTSTDGNTKIALNNTQSGGYFNFVVTMDTLPGNHTFGVVLIGHLPPIILSEGQATYALSPGSNGPKALTLNGVLGSGYIECDTAANIALKNGCAGSYNAGTGLYTLTAIGADYEGFPIVYQNSGTLFDNGGFTVVETTATPILTLSNNGPFTNPGSQLSGPSGAWYVNGNFSYGQAFNVKCNALGTATLGLKNTQAGPLNAVTGQTDTLFPPNPESTSNYPGAGLLPVGSKKPGDPYNRGVNPNALTNLATINCDANLGLTVN